VGDGIAQFGDITDGGKQFQLQCGMARTDVIEQYRHVFFEVTALRHETSHRGVGGFGSTGKG
jgi:hypothetical protein